MKASGQCQLAGVSTFDSMTLATRSRDRAVGLFVVAQQNRSDQLPNTVQLTLAARLAQQLSVCSDSRGAAARRPWLNFLHTARAAQLGNHPVVFTETLRFLPEYGVDFYVAAMAAYPTIARLAYYLPEFRTSSVPDTPPQRMVS